MTRLAGAIAGACAAVATLVVARAGADTAMSAHWSFEVLEVARVAADTQLITLRPSPPGRSFPQSCATFRVSTRYDLSDWSRAGREAFTSEGHERSLTLLRQARATGEIVLLGRLGRGFAAASDAPPCDVSSHGLQVIVDPSGTPVIFSLYEEPSADFLDATAP